MKIAQKTLVLIEYWPNQLAVMAFFAILIITQTIALKVLTVEKENETYLVKEEANHVKNQLENALNYSHNAVKIIGFLVERNLEDEYFNKVSKDLLSKNKFMYALQLVKDYTIIKTYPLKDNKITIGYNIIKSPKHKEAIYKSIQQNKIFFEGPINLIQGDICIVGREPIYKNGKFWGFSVVIIKQKNILKAIGIDRSGDKNRFHYQIKGNNNLDFFKNDINFSTGITHKTYIQSGDWTLQVKLKKSSFFHTALIISFFGLFFSIITALFIKQLAEQPIKLKKLVDKKTKDLESLNSILDKRAKEFSSTNKELEYFAYIISHDLQEPLRMISSFLTLLEKKYDSILDEKGKKYIFYAVDGSKRMQTIILDILEFSRAGKYSEKPVEIDLNNLVEEIISYHRISFDIKKTVINYENLPTIFCYKSPVTQIFQNLISNSIKYSKINEKTIININQFEEDEEHWGFAVEDNGVGIEEKYFEKIFVIFQRLSPRDANTGNGMGLAIVKKIVENLGGKIWVKSEINVGTTFYFTIAKTIKNSNE